MNILNELQHISEQLAVLRKNKNINWKSNYEDFFRLEMIEQSLIEIMNEMKGSKYCDCDMDYIINEYKKVNLETPEFDRKNLMKYFDDYFNIK